MIVMDGYSVDEGAVGRTCGWSRDGERCGAPAFRVRGESAYCLKHHRFHQMRKEARARGLFVPTWQQLEWLLPPDMVCHECGDAMLWTVPAGSKKRRATISLQHYRDGSLGLIHLRCNVIHKNRNDVLGEHERPPEGMKPCPACREVLPESDFHRNSLRPDGKATYCKACRSAQDTVRCASRRALSSALLSQKHAPKTVFYESGSRLVPPIAQIDGDSR